MILKKLDRRMNGHGFFKYGVDFAYDRNPPAFDEVRLWCWETFGASTELDIWHARDRPVDTRNERWAWDRGHYNKSFRCIIYLATDEEAAWFKLRWLDGDSK
jgi:hypothetical protein